MEESGASEVKAAAASKIDLHGSSQLALHSYREAAASASEFRPSGTAGGLAGLANVSDGVESMTGGASLADGATP